MAQSFKFYTTGNMRTVDVTFVTNQRIPNRIEYAFDNNLDTFWEALNISNIDIELDFGVGNTISVSAFAVFCRNYNETFFTTVAELYYSDNGTSWTFWPSTFIQFSNLQSNGIVLIDTPTTRTHRYWKIAISGVINIPEVAGFFLLTKHTIASGNLEPDVNDKNYAIKKQRAPGGRTLKRQLNRVAGETFKRTWLLTDDTDRDVLEAIWDDSGGHALPLFMVEDSDDARLVEIVEPVAFNDNKMQHQLYRPSITFRTLPYIEDGELF